MQTLIEKYEDQILEIKRRLFALQAFEEELQRVIRNKDFLIRNDLVWLFVSDTWDMLIIDLASWIDGVLKEGGLIGQIGAGHVSELPRARAWRDPMEQRHEDLTRTHDGNHAAAYQRLFPNSTGPKPEWVDLKALGERFRAATKHVDKDRNQHRAHRYAGKVKPSAAKLTVPEIAAAFEICERLMLDLRLAGAHSCFSYHDLSGSNAKVVGRDLVDMVICGTSIQMRMAMGDKDRKAFYDQLHAAHDVAGANSIDVFNDNRFLYPKDEASGPAA
jgi:hypothetical protein